MNKSAQENWSEKDLSLIAQKIEAIDSEITKIEAMLQKLPPNLLKEKDLEMVKWIKGYRQSQLKTKNEIDKRKAEWKKEVAPHIEVAIRSIRPLVLIPFASLGFYFVPEKITISAIAGIALGLTCSWLIYLYRNHFLRGYEE
jgi:hypothetical protein